MKKGHECKLEETMGGELYLNAAEVSHSQKRTLLYCCCLLIRRLLLSQSSNSRRETPPIRASHSPQLREAETQHCGASKLQAL